MLSNRCGEKNIWYSIRCKTNINKDHTTYEKHTYWSLHVMVGCGEMIRYSLDLGEYFDYTYFEHDIFLAFFHHYETISFIGFKKEVPQKNSLTSSTIKWRE